LSLGGNNSASSTTTVTQTSAAVVARREADNNNNSNNKNNNIITTTMKDANTKKKNDNENDNDKITKTVTTVENKLLVSEDVDVDIDMEALLKPCRAALQQGEGCQSPLSLTWRRHQLLTMRALVTENQEALCEALHKDMGKSHVSNSQYQYSTVQYIVMWK
jgi:acyl-CoA reductase-like NAD-dependent aldehyde dehydrogenase